MEFLAFNRTEALKKLFAFNPDTAPSLKVRQVTMFLGSAAVQTVATQTETRVKANV